MYSNKANTYTLLSALFFILLVLELGWHTFFTKAFGVYGTPVVIFINGLLLVVSAYLLNRNKELLLQNNNHPFPQKMKWILAFVFVICAVIFFFLYKESIQKFEINPVYSDVIPTLINYNKQLLSGQFPYAPIEYPGWTVYPNYLTFQWLPYIVPELLHFDYRLFALFIFYLAVLIAYLLCFNPKWSWFEIVVKLLYPFFLLWMFKDHHPDVFGFTTELTIAAFYVLFGIALFAKRWVWMVLAASLCLYSRFSFIFLLPFFALFMFYQKGWQTSVKIIAGITLVGVLVYVLPFMTIDPHIFTRGLHYYADAAIGEWVVYDGQQYPLHIGRGFGFAVYFYDFYNGTLAEKVAACRQWHIILSVVATGLISLLFWLKRNTLKQDSFYALLALKLYFLVFYAFIHVPYLYLQLVPLSVSIVIFYKLNLFEKQNTN